MSRAGEVRAAKYVSPLWAIELNYDLLRMASPNTELQEIIGFFEQCQGEDASFYFEPPTLSPVAAQALGVGDGTTATFAFVVSIGRLFAYAGECRRRLGGSISMVPRNRAASR